jgi:hypothetical protein
MGSLSAAADHVLSPFASSGVLAPAAVWALAALAAPWLVRGRTPLLDAFRAIVWATLLVGATSAAITAVHGTDAVGAAPTAVLGAAAAAIALLVPLAVPSLRNAWRRSSFGDRLP